MESRDGAFRASRARQTRERRTEDGATAKSQEGEAILSPIADAARAKDDTQGDTEGCAPVAWRIYQRLCDALCMSGLVTDERVNHIANPVYSANG